MKHLSKKAIADVVSTLVEKKIKEENYSGSLQREFGMDSIILVEAIIALEETFGMEFQDADLVVENFENIEAIYHNLLKY